MKWKNVFVLPLLSNNTADREFFTIKYHTLLENMIPENKKNISFIEQKPTLFLF